MTINVGDKRQVQCTFYNSTGNVADPTKVTLKVTRPTGTDTYYYSNDTSTITLSSTGVYQKDLYLSEPGEWTYNFKGTGVVVGSEEKTFKVRRNK